MRCRRRSGTSATSSSPRTCPPELKKGSLGKFSIDVENGFLPYYVVSDEKKRTVADLKKALKNADELFLATDEDREGEAIAWHLLEVLKPTVPVKRMVFHEITQEAIQRAQENTRDIDTALVDAQETRRILDRLYGFEVSPVLWRKVGPGLSAGRVQSAATRLVVDRERERLAFVAASYWDLTAQLLPQTAASSGFESRLARLDGKRIASGRDYDDRGALTSDVVALDETAAETLASALRERVHGLHRVESRDEALHASPRRAVHDIHAAAGGGTQTAVLGPPDDERRPGALRERLHHLYAHRLADALAAGDHGGAQPGDASSTAPTRSPRSPRHYTGKSKNAQEAHEAIRPSGEEFRTPSELSSTLRGHEFKLYDLIWKRTVASQMADARGSTASVTITAATASAGTADFTASGTVITFRGFLSAYEEGHDEERNEQDASPSDDQRSLPPLTVGEVLDLGMLEAKGHETSSPPRYTEASLVKALEELGIGRPSTYASIISTIIDRGYVTPRGTALVPNWIAFSVVRLLEQHFGDLVEYHFTAEMEDDLDRIAGGETDRVDWLSEFYFGSDKYRGLRTVIDNLGEIDAREINSVRITDDITLRIGKYGPYLEVPPADGSAPDAAPRRVNVPEELAPDELTAEKARELVDAPVVGDRELGVNPETGKMIVAKDGRYGPYVTELEPVAAEEQAAEPAEDSATIAEGVAVDAATGEVMAPDAAPAKAAPKKAAPKKKKADAPKPRTASLFKSMDPATVDLETALRLLNLPRVVGQDPESGVDITAQNGRYGPYIKKGTDSRSLEAEEQIFSIDLAGALEVFAQPKYGARRPTSALKEFEADPESGKPIRVRDGRFGPYVTDGVTNATIPRGEEVESIDFDRAVQLLADKRAKGPAKPKRSGPRSKRAPVKRK